MRSHHTSRILANLSQLKDSNPNSQLRHSLSWTCPSGRDSSPLRTSHFSEVLGSIISSTGRRVSEATTKKEELEHGTGSDGFRQSPTLIKQLYIENRWQNSACSTSEPWYKYQTQPKSKSTEREAASRKTHQTKYVRYNSIWYPIQSLNCMSWSYFQ